MELKKIRQYCTAEVFCFFYFFSFGIHLELLTPLLVSKLCSQSYNKTLCSKLESGIYKTQESIVYRQASSWNTVSFLCTYLPSLVTLIPFGAIIEQVSKTKLFLIPTSAIGLQSVAYMLCAKNISSHVAFVAVSGILKSFYADVQGVLLLAYLFVTDMTKPEQRTFRIVIVSALGDLGIGIGSYIAGILNQQYGLTVAFMSSGVASLINFIFCIFILALEKITEHKPIQSQERKKTDSFIANTVKLSLSAYKNLYLLAKKYILLETSKEVLLLLMAGLLLIAAINGEGMVIVAFVNHSPLSLSPRQTGTYLLSANLVRGIGGIIISSIFIRIFKLSDYSIAIIGASSMAASYIGTGLSSQLSLLYTFIWLSAGLPFSFPTIRAILTKKVEKCDIAKVMTLKSMLVLLGLSVYSFFVNFLFKISEATFPGLCLIALAFTCILAVQLLLPYCLKQRQSEHRMKYTNVDKECYVEIEGLNHSEQNLI